MAVRISDAYFDLFRSVGRCVKFTSNQHITRVGQKAEDIYLITSGRAIVYLLTENGKQLTMNVMKKGTVLGDSSFTLSGIQNYNIMAVTDVEMIVCKTAELFTVLQEHGDVLLLLLQHMTEENHYLASQVIRLAYFSSEQKIAAYILDMAGRNKSIPFTHSDIANGTGLNRVTVSRAMRKFKEQQLIDYTYGIIYINDKEKLKAIVPNG